MIIQAEFLRAVRSAFVPDFSPSHPLDELRQGQRLRGGQFEFNLYIFHGYTSQGHGKGRCSASARTQASSRRFCRPSADCARARACASILLPISHLQAALAAPLQLFLVAVDFAGFGVD